WVRARGMSIYQMALMGGSALGAAVWGKVTNLTDLPTSLMIAAGSGVVLMLLVQRLATDRSVLEDLSPSSHGTVPFANEPPKTGHVVVTVEYLIDPLRADEFRRLMRVSRRSRLRQGALSWDLLHDLNDPGRFVEQIVDHSWTEHLRRFERVMADDVAIRERKLGFHLGEEPPVVARFSVEAAPLRR
ncbi:MAG: MFS transporter, partial [Burkholderiales bacterium]